METLIRLVLAVILLVPYSEVFLEASEETGVPVSVLVAQAWEESKFDPLAVSREGCRGISQFGEAAWSQFGTGDFDDAFAPKLAIPAQARYMDWIHDVIEEESGEYRWTLVAYIWGPQRLKDFRRKGGEWENIPWWIRDYAENILAQSEQVIVEKELGVEIEDVRESNPPERLPNNSPR